MAKRTLISKILLYSGILLLLIGFLGITFLTPVVQQTAFLDKSPVWSARFSSAECSASSGEQTINAYTITSESDSKLKKFTDSKNFGFKNWFIYRCGYGNLNSNGDTNAYNRLCNIGVDSYKLSGTGGNLKIMKCKNEYDLSINPELSNLCRVVLPNTPIGSQYVFGVPFSNIYSTDDMATTEGTFDKKEKESTLAIGIDDDTFGKMETKVNVKSQHFRLIIKEGNGYSYPLDSGCSIKDIVGDLTAAFPSSVKTTETNNFKGENYLAFGRTINWIWGYAPLISDLVIKHDKFGDIYVDRENSYIPLEKIDNYLVAFENKRVLNEPLIECVPNRLTCSPQAKKIKDPSQITCSEFKGLAEGSRIITSSGASCIYKCVSGKPSYSSCLTITANTCPDGSVYSQEKSTCVKIDISNPPNFGKPQEDKTKLYLILGVLGIIGLLLITQPKKPQQMIQQTKRRY